MWPLSLSRKILTYKWYLRQIPLKGQRQKIMKKVMVSKVEIQFQVKMLPPFTQLHYHTYGYDLWLKPSLIGGFHQIMVELNPLCMPENPSAAPTGLAENYQTFS